MELRFDNRLVESLMATLAEALKESSVYKEYERRASGFSRREEEFRRREDELQSQKSELQQWETLLREREQDLSTAQSDLIRDDRVRLIVQLGADKFGDPTGSIRQRLDAIRSIEMPDRLAMKMLTITSWDERLAE